MENKISVLIIAKNESEVIEAAIKSVKDLASEVILVDDSYDETPRIAEKLGAKVIRNKFKNFADQRNLAASAAHNEWIFYLDADERVTPEFETELKAEILNPGSENIAGFWVKRKTFFYGRDWHFTDRVQRVFRREKLKGWHGVVHETPEVEGRLMTINEPILHYTHRNFEQMIAKTNEWSEFESDLRLHSHHPKMSLWRFPRVMVTAFASSYFGQSGWKNGAEGVIEAIYQAFSMFITYAKLWEKQNIK